MKINKIIWVMLGVGLLFCISGGAIAADYGGNQNYYYEGPIKPTEGKIRIGQMTIVPGLALQEEYDDNIFLGNGDNDTTERKESDWIAHLKPSLVAKYDMMGRGAMSLGYLGDFAYYNTNDKNNWATHNVAFKGDYKAPVGFIVGLSNTYFNGDDPYADASQYKLGQKTKRWDDDLQTKVGYEFVDRFRVLAFYNYFKQNYDQDVDYSQNYDSNEVGAGVEMRVMPMTWAFLRYYTGERNYNSHPDSVPNFSDANDASYKWNRVNTGLTWDATAKISGELNVGYQWLDAKNDIDPYGNPYANVDTWIAATRVNYIITPKTRVGAELFRATRFTGGDLNQYYDETGFGLNLNQAVFTKGVLRGGAGYALNDYNNPRDDKNYKALVAFDYYFTDWLMAGLEYRYWNRDSNEDVYDFADNRAMMTVGIAY